MKIIVKIFSKKNSAKCGVFFCFFCNYYYNMHSKIKGSGNLTDIEIARSIKPKKIIDIAKKLGIEKNNLELYGDYKAKINLCYGKKHGKLILVTAINPTSSGIGKTTVSIGLADAFSKLNKNVCLALRQPSLGPVFGLKGGATGGGYSQIVPMEDINLHFTGDFHAITTANNLLCAMIDNHIFQGNNLGIDVNNILFSRCMDMNDRALRNVECAKGVNNGQQREEHFVITAASEIMAILCLANDFEDLKLRLGNIIIALDDSGNPVFAKDLKANEAMAIVLKDAIKPNLVQTLEGTPAIVHGGPFANIAHGCNSIIATKMAMSYADYCITEAGFGADLGAEKFFDIKCRYANIKPDAVVVVATIKALKLHGGVDKNNLDAENVNATVVGVSNLLKHIDNIKNIYKLPVCVTLNKFNTDTQDEIEAVVSMLKNYNVEVIVNDVWGKGGNGAIDLAQKVASLCESKSNFEFAYELEDDVQTKLEKIAKKVYGANAVVFEEKAKQCLINISKLGYDKYPVVVAKTQFSLSDNAKLLNCPTDFDITIRDIEIRSGAQFLVAIAGKMLLMPGLPSVPNAEKMTIDKNFIIEGLF